MKKYIIIIILIIISYSFGYFSHTPTKETHNDDFTESRLKGNYTYINPLLECDNHTISSSNNLDNLRNLLIEKFGKDPETISIYYRDMNNGPWFGINEKNKFSPASLLKVPLMIAILKKAEKDPEILNKEILNTEVYNPKTQNFQPEITLIPNKKYTIKQLIEQMIIYSDDISYNMLNNEIGYADVMSVYNNLGVDISEATTNPNGNIITVKAYASFFRILFNASYLNYEMSEYALSVLNQIKFNEGLRKGIPKNINVSHKFGERQYLDTGLKQLHDCGIVYVPGKPYILCVMTKGNNFTTLKNTLSDVSKMVYEYISSPNN